MRLGDAGKRSSQTSCLLLTGRAGWTGPSLSSSSGAAHTAPSRSSRGAFRRYSAKHSTPHERAFVQALPAHTRKARISASIFRGDLGAAPSGRKANEATRPEDTPGTADVGSGIGSAGPSDCSLHASCARRCRAAGGVRGPAPEGPNDYSAAADQFPSPSGAPCAEWHRRTLRPSGAWDHCRHGAVYKHHAPLGLGRRGWRAGRS
jgi:hypothetical protein